MKGLLTFMYNPDCIVYNTNFTRYRWQKENRSLDVLYIHT